MVYDVIIVWWGAAGLFCSLFLPKHSKKCIIEKTERFGTKVLMSWWERCNLTNINFDPSIHYIGQLTKSLPSLFHAFGPEDIMAYLHDHGVETHTEANGRVVLKSWKARELVDFLVDQSQKNDTDLLLSHDVLSIQQGHSEWNEESSIHDTLHFVQGDKKNHTFVITTSAWIYMTKQVIIATWGMTYPQAGASPFAYEIAEQLWHSLAVPHQALCGIETQEDFSSLAGNTLPAKITLYANNKIVYSATWSLLFTHWWISGPIIFNTTLYMDQDISLYTLQCDFDLASSSKKVVQYFKLAVGNTLRDIRVKALRPITEAKVSVWWILLKELDQHFQSKKIPWLYFIGESLDITWNTWWYNLQWAWTSAYVCAKKIGTRK